MKEKTKSERALFDDNVVPSSQMWVSPTGDDRGDGSEGSPLATIQAAADRAEPGTAILVKAGSYYENVEITKNGLDDQPIWFISADGPGKANIIPTNQDRATIVGRGTENVIIRDFTIDGADNRSGIEFTQGGYDFTNLVKNIVIEGNKIIDVGLDGIKIAQTENIDVIGNLVEGGREEGIDFTTVWNANIAQNEVRNLEGRGAIVVKGGSNNIIIEENFVHNVNVDGIVVGGWTDANLFQLFQGFEAKNITVRDNVVQAVEKRPINILAGQDSIITNNTLDPQNDYYTVINLEGDNNGLITKNITITDNTITRDNWIYVTPGHGEGLYLDNNNVGIPKQKIVGLDAYNQNQTQWLQEPDNEQAPVEPYVETQSLTNLITGWRLERAFDGLDDALVVQHESSSKIDEGALAFSFNTNDATKQQGIVSKDAAYFGTGGHISAWIENEKLVVRLQDQNGSHTVETQNGAIRTGIDHEAVISFGQDGMKLTLDDKLVDTNDFAGGIQGNDEPWVFGASAIYSSDLVADKLTQPFDGTISQVNLFAYDPIIPKTADETTPIVPENQTSDGQITIVQDEESDQTQGQNSDLVTGWQLERAFDGLDDALVVQHESSSKIDEGALAFSFNTNDATKQQGIVSKDAAYFGTGGHISAWIENEKLVVRLQDQNGSHTVETQNGAIRTGIDHEAVISFGQDGMKLTLDDKLVDTNDFAGGIQGNDEPWVFGASAIYSSDLVADKLTQPFDGTISQVNLFAYDPIIPKTADETTPIVPENQTSDGQITIVQDEESDQTQGQNSDLVTGWQLERAFDGLDDALVVQHESSSKIDEGALAFSFNTNDATKQQGIVSKDAAYFGTGGHISAWIENEKLVVRLQDQNGSHTVETQNGAIRTGIDHEAVISFGQDGMKLTLDDKLVDTNDFAGGIQGNDEPWVFGASAIYSSDLVADKLTQPFDGTIGQVALFDGATTDSQFAFDVDNTWNIFDERQDEFAPISEA